MKQQPKHRPPQGLRPTTRKWFLSVVNDWTLEEHHTRLLALAARAFDEAETAEALYRREGLVISMPSGAKRPHPAIRVALEARACFMRALRELDLDLEPPAVAKRPPTLRSIAGGRH
jgi:hypothetical protein